jgi:hypothetical protein
MFWLAIVILVMMILLGLVRAIIGLRLLKSGENSEKPEREIRIFLSSLADVVLSLIGLAAVSTKAFPPVETLIATWLLLILIRVAIRTGGRTSSSES